MIKRILPVIFAIFSCIQISFAGTAPDCGKQTSQRNHSIKKTPEVVIYSADFCSYCTKAKEFFDEKKVSYKVIEVNNKKLVDELEQKSGKRTVPQIFIDGKHVGSYLSLVKANMTGELDDLLGLNKETAQAAS